MVDDEMAKQCHMAPPECRLVQVGKPTGTDPGYYAESWGTPGALSYHETHMHYLAWGSCPSTMSDAERTPCGFGSSSGSSNCDDWWTPNLAPAKQFPRSYPLGQARAASIFARSAPSTCAAEGDSCSGGPNFNGPFRCCDADNVCQTAFSSGGIDYKICTKRSASIFPPPPPPIVCAQLNEQCAGGADYSGPTSCCSMNHMCELVGATSVGVCVRDPSRPFSVADLKPCSSVPPIERNVPRRDCPSGSCEFQTPHEIVAGGIYQAFRPRSDWMILHDFYFPAGESNAKVTVEVGKGYGGAAKLWQMCRDNGAPAGCPDLRLIFGILGLNNPYTGAPFNWDEPSELNAAFQVYNATLHPMCNTPGVRHPDNTLHILDMCLETSMEDENYWYFHAMMDFDVTSKCQLAPPSCRLVKMGKPDGHDPTYWEESWDTWGALAYNDTHINLAAWASCPKVMSDPDMVPCNFGSVPGSSNCDSWWAPNVAPAKQDPPMRWPPEPLEAHPDGPSVIARFCGPSCKYVGEIPQVPPSSRHSRRSVLEEDTERLLYGHGRKMQSLPNVCPTNCVACAYEGEQCQGSPSYTGPINCCDDTLACQTIGGTEFGVCIKAVPDKTLPPPPPVGVVNAKCEGKIISFSVVGQPNVAVGFIDTTTTTVYPMHIADIQTDVSDDGDAPYWVSSGLFIDCSTAGQLRISWAEGSASELLAPQFTWNATEHPGQRWYTAVQLVDIMYETWFDGRDVLYGHFIIQINNAFLEEKFDWVSRKSNMNSLVDTIKAMKRATGTCPLMYEGHDRNEDLGGAFLMRPEIRRDYAIQTVVHDLNGVPDYASHDFNQLLWLMKMQQKDDAQFLVSAHAHRYLAPLGPCDVHGATVHL
eukprot:scaffold50547_cov33-Tisochrysis_lutea.AAC.3